MFMAPPWLDPATGRLSGGEVSVTLVGPQQSTQVASALRLGALVAAPDSPNLGRDTLYLLEGSCAALVEARAAVASAGSNEMLRSLSPCGCSTCSAAPCRRCSRRGWPR